MKLIDAIQVNSKSRIAFVGAGGKSTSMFRLARQWEGKCIVSTSTHLAKLQIKLADSHFIIKNKSDLDQIKELLPEGITLLSGPFLENQRVDGLSNEIFEVLCTIANTHKVPVFIEADGSRRLPLKAPAPHEPAIPPCVNAVVVLAGLKGLGKKLNKKAAHRPELISQLTGLPMGEKIEIENLKKLLAHPKGGLKNISEGMEKILVINQADSPDLLAEARKISNSLLEQYHKVIISCMDEHNNEVILKEQRVAGIVLAAGGSERLGKPKQLLDWEGEAFVRVVSKTAIEAGLDPVIVVFGSASNESKKVLEGLDLISIENKDWQKGQSSSVKIGLENLPKAAGAVVFLLVDQPQIPQTLIRKLVETHATNPEPIVVTLVDGRRANPVLFDKTTFSDLLEIEGDKGGRQIFSKFSAFYLPWLDTIVGLDVDTEEDYLQLLQYKKLN